MTIPDAIRPIVDRLTSITHEHARPPLDAQVAVDPRAGVIIANLEGITAMRSDAGQVYRFYAARVLPPDSDAPNYVNPHVHQHGEEPYHFLSGAGGEMNSGRISSGRVRWSPATRVGPGDTVVIREGEVHSFRNNGTEPADFVFACPDSHLIDKSEDQPEGDRQFTEGLEDGIPPWHRTRP